MKEFNLYEYEITNVFNNHGIEAYSFLDKETNDINLYLYLTPNSLSETIIKVPAKYTSSAHDIFDYAVQQYPEILL